MLRWRYGMLPWRLMRRRYQRPAMVTGAAFVVLFILYRLITTTGRDDDDPKQPRLTGVTVPPGPLLNAHMYFYLIDNTAVCGARGDRPVHVLLFITSRPGHFEQRQRLRDFYSSDAVVASWRPRAVRILFFVAVDVVDESLQPLVYDESGIHGDVIQEEYPDDERAGAAASRLTMTAIKWALTHCTAARYLVRTSDAVVVNPPRLVAALAAQFGVDAPPGQEAVAESRRQRAIVCQIAAGQRAVRDPSHVRYVPAEAYSEPWLPEHCGGDAYAMTYEMAKHLFVAYQHTAYVLHEAAYVTGILRRAVGLGAHLLPLPAADGGSSSAGLGALQWPPAKGAANGVLGSAHVFLSIPLANVTARVTPRAVLPGLGADD